MRSGARSTGWMRTHDDPSAPRRRTHPGRPDGTPGGGGTARDWWEARYAERDGIWSGRVNAVLADVVAGLPSGGGRALDLGVR